MVKSIVSPPPVQSLAASAKTSLLFGGGATLLRDVLQFVTMLVLVRLLAPEDYGSAALAQSIIGLISVASFGTFVIHALQLRNPEDVDWQAHFTAAVVINCTLFCIALLVAWSLSFTHKYQSAALPLAVLATLLLVEIAGSLRHRMVQTRHDWKRFRLLLFFGALLGSAAGLIIALAGGGVWALVIQMPLYGLPAAIDLFWHGRWRPDWSWSWARYRDTVCFATTRMGTATVQRGRQTIEQTLLTGTYDLAALGIFTRAIGLATLIAGRIGSIATVSLYPIVTRAEERSDRFQRIAGLVLRGVFWATAPAAIFLALSAEKAVTLLYGPKWSAVAPMLPLAVIGVALAGTASAVSSLLLANNNVRTCLFIDIASGTFGTALAFCLIPMGIQFYLGALALHGTVVLALTLGALLAKRGIAPASLPSAFLPALIAGAGAALVVYGLRQWYPGNNFLAVQFIAEAGVFGLAYLALLRAAFPGAMRKLLDVAPGGQGVAAALRL